jgi:hypothetical protein
MEILNIMKTAVYKRAQNEDEKYYEGKTWNVDYTELTGVIAIQLLPHPQ